MSLLKDHDHSAAIQKDNGLVTTDVRGNRTSTAVVNLQVGAFADLWKLLRTSSMLTTGCFDLLLAGDGNGCRCIEVESL